MSGVAVNPDELRALAQTLATGADQVTQAAAQMLGAVGGCDSWQDTKKAQCEQEIADLHAAAVQFGIKTTEQIDYLNALASAADDYLGVS